MMRSVEWLVGGRLVVVLLDGPEAIWYVEVGRRVAQLPAGAERTLAVNELRTVMDLYALLGARMESGPVREVVAA